MVKLLLPWYGGTRREVTCGLVDAGPGGIGVIMADRLTTGTRVSIDAQVSLGDQRFRITGDSEVANSRVVAFNEYRVGLRFVDVTWERLADEGPAAKPHTP